MDNCEVLLRLVQKETGCPFLVAIDGRCASGKTTLAGKLRSALKCNVVHMDNFYLPFAKRTEERMAQSVRF
jgi:uridine kinase